MEGLEGILETGAETEVQSPVAGNESTDVGDILNTGKEVVDEEKIDKGESEKGFNVSEFFGEGVTNEEIRKRLEFASTISEDDVTNLRQVEQSYNSMKDEVSKQKPAHQIKNETYLKLDKLEQESPEKAEMYKKLLFGDDDHRAILKLKFINDNPELKSDNAAIDRFVKRKYPVLFDENADTESDEYQDALTDMKVDAISAKRALMSGFDAIEIETPKVEDKPDSQQSASPEKEKEVSARKVAETWKAQFSRMIKEPGEIKSTFKTSDGKSVDVSIPIPGEKSSGISDSVAQFIIDNELELNDTNRGEVKSLISKLTIANNIDWYTDQVANRVRQTSDKQWVQEVSNAHDETKSKDRGDSGNSNGSVGDAMMDVIRGDF